MKKIKELEVMVADVIREAHDTSTLLLFTGNDSLDYQAGHFITIDPHQFPSLERWTEYFEDIKGKKEPARAYSLSSAPGESYLAITVKEERYISGISPYPPLLSPILTHRTEVGTRMKIIGFTGAYTMNDEIRNDSDHILHICAGSGVVPSFSIVKRELQNGSHHKHTILCSDKLWEDVIFRDQMTELQKNHPDRFKIIRTITRETKPQFSKWGVNSGRVSKEMITRLLPDPTASSVFVCGPALSSIEKKDAKAKGVSAQPKFLESVLDIVQEIGVPKTRIRRESWG